MVSRYRNDGTILGGTILESAEAVVRIRAAVRTGSLLCRTIILKEGERLDRIANDVYGDGRLWWVIAAASNIGWWMQVPPGTRIQVPIDMSHVVGLV